MCACVRACVSPRIRRAADNGRLCVVIQDSEADYPANKDITIGISSLSIL